MVTPNAVEGNRNSQNKSVNHRDHRGNAFFFSVVSVSLWLALLLRDFFDLAKHAEQVATENLQDVRLAVSAIQQLLRYVRIARHVFELFRHRRNAVVVRTEADVIDAGYLDD